MDHIIRQSSILRNLVDDLLMLSSLENAQALPEFGPVDVSALVQEQSADAAVISKAKHEIQTQLEQGLTVNGSRAELTTAIRNLMSNAIRYTPEGGKITIGIEKQKDALRLFVSDTGIGIAPEHLGRLTERFYRVDKDRSRSNGGTGLGLAIVKRIALRHDGRLEISSLQGKGSTFALVLPEHRVVAKEFKQEPASGPETPLKQEQPNLQP
jgi:two-component system, OmpR family, phosphate regulon sensor histidine kinase PhoR